MFDHADDRGAVEPLDDEAAHPTPKPVRLPGIYGLGSENFNSPQPEYRGSQGAVNGRESAVYGEW